MSEKSRIRAAWENVFLTYTKDFSKGWRGGGGTRRLSRGGGEGFDSMEESSAKENTLVVPWLAICDLIVLPLMHSLRFTVINRIRTELLNGFVTLIVLVPAGFHRNVTLIRWISFPSPARHRLPPPSQQGVSTKGLFTLHGTWIGTVTGAGHGTRINES